MKKNMGSADKAIRIVIAAVIFILYFTGIITGVIGILLMVFAVIFVFTSFVGTCPLYLPFGLSTLKKNVKVQQK